MSPFLSFSWRLTGLFSFFCLALGAYPQNIEPDPEHTSSNTDIGLGSSGFLMETFNYIYKGQTFEFADFQISPDEVCADSVRRAFLTIHGMSKPELRWASLAPIVFTSPNAIRCKRSFFQQNISLPVQERSYKTRILIDSRNMMVGTQDSVKVGVCNEPTTGPFIIQLCAGTWAHHFFIIPYEIELTRVASMNGSLKNVRLSWEIPEITYWSLHHYAIFLNENDTIRLTNLGACTKVADSLQPACQEFISAAGMRNVNSFWAVAGYDDQGELIALSGSRQAVLADSSFSLITPGDGAILDTVLPVFSWEEVPGATYELSYGESPDFTGCTTISGLTQNTYNCQTPLADHTTYYWKVLTGDSICSNETGWCFGTNTINVPPSSFLLQQPPDLSVIDSQTPVFRWENSSDPGDQLNYGLLISTMSDFSDTLYEIKTHLSYLRQTILLPQDTNLYWKTYAVDAEHDTVYAANPCSLRIELDDAPGMFTLGTPDYNTHIGTDTRTPTFTWTRSQNVDSNDTIRYSLYIAQDSLFSNPMIYGAIPDTTFTLTEPLTEDMYYYWKVKASDQGENERWQNGLPNYFLVNEENRMPGPFVISRPFQDQHLSTGMSCIWTRPPDDPVDIQHYELIYSSDTLFTDPDTAFYIPYYEYNYQNLFGFYKDTIAFVNAPLSGEPAIPEGEHYMKMRCLSKTHDPADPFRCLLLTGISSSNVLRFHLGADTFLLYPSFFRNFSNEDTLEASKVYQLHWTYSNVNYVDVYFSYDNGNSWELIEDSVSAALGAQTQSGYPIRIPNTLTNNLHVMIRDVDNQHAFDINVTGFVVIPPDKQLTLTSPTGGDSLKVTSPQGIEWTSLGVERVSVMASYNAGVSWDTLARNISGSSLSWTIPNIPTDSCLIKVEDFHYPLLQSETWVTIYPVRIIHVSKSGNDLSGSGTATHPYLTIQKAVDEYEAFDSVHVAEGLYTEKTLIPPRDILSIQGGFDTETWSFDPASCETEIAVPGDNAFECIAPVDGDYRRYYFRDLTVRNSATGFLSNSTLLNLSLEKIEISGCGTGISTNGSTLICNRLQIMTCSTGMLVYNPYGFSPYHSRVTNTLFKNCNYGFYGSLAYNTFFANNTLVNLGTGLYLYNCPMEVSNCIISSCNTGAIALTNFYNVSLSHNLFFDNQSDFLNYPPVFGLDSTHVFADPLFIDTLNVNFRLFDDSPAIGAGKANDLLVDLDGNSRPVPQGSVPDLGAYENLFGSPATPMLRIWSGASDTGWITTENWVPAGIPSSVDTLFIPRTAIRMPVITIEGRSCQDLFIDGDASLFIDPEIKFRINGNLFLNASPFE